jgi:ABC-type nitrate/sulfonate/bicarbonate transport system permease component
MSRATRYRIALLVACLTVLEICCRLGLIDPSSVIPPTEMIAGARDALSVAATRHEILLTLESVFASIVLAVTVGIGAGLALHQLPRIRRALDPFLASYYAIPTFIFYPVFIVLFGLNRWPLVAIGFVFSVVAVIINTLDGLSRVPRALVRTALALRLSRTQTILHVTFPAAMPWLLTGVKLAIAYSFIGVIAGEFVLSNDGLGHIIAFAYNSFENPTMYGLILVLFVIVGGINMAIWSQERRIYERRGGR